MDEPKSQGRCDMVTIAHLQVPGGAFAYIMDTFSIVKRKDEAKHDE